MSYSEPNARFQGFGSKERLEVLKVLGLAIDMVEVTTGKDAFADPEGAQNAYEAMAEIIDAAFAVRPGGPIDTTSPTEGQEAIIKNPAARTLGQNVRDALMEGVLPKLQGADAVFHKKSKVGRKARR